MVWLAESLYAQPPFEMGAALGMKKAIVPVVSRDLDVSALTAAAAKSAISGAQFSRGDGGAVCSGDRGPVIVNRCSGIGATLGLKYAALQALDGEFCGLGDGHDGHHTGLDRIGDYEVGGFRHAAGHVQADHQ